MLAPNMSYAFDIQVFNDATGDEGSLKPGTVVTDANGNAHVTITVKTPPGQTNQAAKIVTKGDFGQATVQTDENGAKFK